MTIPPGLGINPVWCKNSAEACPAAARHQLPTSRDHYFRDRSRLASSPTSSARSRAASGIAADSPQAARGRGEVA